MFFETSGKMTLGKTDTGHDILPVFVALREQKRVFLLPGNKFTREKCYKINMSAPPGADVV